MHGTGIKREDQRYDCDVLYGIRDRTTGHLIRQNGEVVLFKETKHLHDVLTALNTKKYEI